MFAGVERFCDFVLKKKGGGEGGKKIKIKQNKKGGLEKKFTFALSMWVWVGMSCLGLCVSSKFHRLVLCNPPAFSY